MSSFGVFGCVEIVVGARAVLLAGFRVSVLACTAGVVCRLLVSGLVLILWVDVVLLGAWAVAWCLEVGFVGGL